MVGGVLRSIGHHVDRLGYFSCSCWNLCLTSCLSSGAGGGGSGADQCTTETS